VNDWYRSPWRVDNLILKNSHSPMPATGPDVSQQSTQCSHSRTQNHRPGADGHCRLGEGLLAASPRRSASKSHSCWPWISHARLAATSAALSCGRLTLRRLPQMMPLPPRTVAAAGALNPRKQEVRKSGQEHSCVQARTQPGRGGRYCLRNPEERALPLGGFTDREPRWWSKTASFSREIMLD